eukprot:scaffold16768_cov117-Isochrysis_galbana.AAC.2
MHGVEQASQPVPGITVRQGLRANAAASVAEAAAGSLGNSSRETPDRPFSPGRQQLGYNATTDNAAPS